MKKTIILIVLSVLGLAGLRAQTYESLWSDTKKALEADLPQTALRHVAEIRARAVADGNDAWLLKALITELVVSNDISPDSANAVCGRMEEALATETRPVVKALWQSALGQLLRNTCNGYEQAADTARLRQARSLMLASVSNPEALATARATDYLPLFTVGDGSRYYNDDLLSVMAQAVYDYDTYLVREGGQYGISEEEKKAVASRVAQYYKEHGPRTAALMSILKMSELTLGESPQGITQSPRYKLLAQTAQEYDDLPLNVETYIRLTQCADLMPHIAEDNGLRREADSLCVAAARYALARYGKGGRAVELTNFIARKEHRSARVAWDGDGQDIYPGSRARLSITAQGVKVVELRFHRLRNVSASSPLLLNNSEKKILSSAKHDETLRLRHEMMATPTWAEQTDTMEYTVPRAGIYVVELVCDGKTQSYRTLYVSALRVLTFEANAETDGFKRVAVVDAQTGSPMPKATVRRYRLVNNGKSMALEKEYTTDSKGMLTLNDAANNPSQVRYYASTATDTYLPDFQNYFRKRTHATGTNAGRTLRMGRLFTDRAIYRPGQKVQFGGMAYSRQGDTYKALTALADSISLYDSNGKLLATTHIRTDEFGSFSGTFALPEVCLPGMFSIRGANTGNTTFKVEEYKRPTFTVEFDTIAHAAALGDTLLLTGRARTLTGMGVDAARVQYATTRHTYFYWRGSTPQPVRGEAVTDDEGRFSIAVPLTPINAEGGIQPRTASWMLYAFTTEVNVTADGGETATGSYTHYAASKPSVLQADVPATMCKEQLQPIVVNNLTPSGLNIPGDGHYTVCAKDAAAPALEGTFHTGNRFVPKGLDALPSGQYRINIALGDMTHTAEVLLFSEHDTKPACPQTHWEHIRQNEQGDSTLVIVGSSCKDVTLFYELIGSKGVIDSRCITFSDSVLHFQLVHREDFGDGANACFAFVRNGKLHTTTASVTRPKPDKRLVLKWSTFRSMVQPGGQEEWQLSVARPDGTPADAVVMARLYDAALDAFVKRPWDFSLSFPRTLPRCFWDTPGLYAPTLYSNFPLRYERVPELPFTCWGHDLFSPTSMKVYAKNELSALSGVRIRGAANPMSAERKMSAKQMAADMADAVLEESVVEEDGAGSGAANAEELPAVPLRQNFEETAFFMPALRTDATGGVNIAFTLPESLTQWNFTALAHDRDMRYGLLESRIVARKELMAQAQMPRFVRCGDKAEVPVTVRNLSDTTAIGQAYIAIIDARTGQELSAQSRKFDVAGGKSATLRFLFSAPAEAGALTVRVVAKTEAYSDGEEHVLPVLSNRVSVMRSVPFSFTEQGQHSVSLAPLQPAKGETDRRLTVEISSNPTWYAAMALPALANAPCYSATDWATRLYAIEIADHLKAALPLDKLALEQQQADGEAWAEVLKRNPDLKQTLLDESPWVAQAEREALRVAELKTLFDAPAIAARRHTAADHLRDLQQPSGAWGWFKGFGASTWVTTDICLLLARQQALTGTDTATDMLLRAMSYLKAETARAVKDMKDYERKHKDADVQVSEQLLRYLYLRALLNEKPDADATYLLNKAERQGKQFTMYGKAAVSVTLAKAGRTAKAEAMMQSLLEHTVCTPQSGRYFDTERAPGGWASYRIPTQTMAIEGLTLMAQEGMAQALQPDVALAEMRLWLLQAKRTQAWQTSAETANALYALLAQPVAQAASNSNGSTALKPLDGTMPVAFSLTNSKNRPIELPEPELKGAATAGYVLQSWADNGKNTATQLNVSLPADGLTWGAAYMQCTQAAENVEATAAGMQLQRRMEVLRGGQWQAVKGSDMLQTGDRIRLVFTLNADRDYDFVSLKTGRAACMEPVQALSGHTYLGQTLCYRVVRDAANEYFFEHLAKGKHVFTEECFIDRTGTYTLTPSTAQCVYAPEFNAGTPAATVSVK